MIPWADPEEKEQLCQQLLQLVAHHDHAWAKISKHMGMSTAQV